MNYEIFKSVPQGSDGAQEAENRRIKEIADELSRLCGIYETQSGVGKTNENGSEEGRFFNGDYEAWDLLPRNVLVDSEGDIFVVDAEIKQI